MSLYTAVATATGRDGRAFTSDGKLDVELALQKELGGTGDGTNPEQLFAAGYAACFATSMQLVAQKKKIDVSGMSVTAEVGLVPNGQGGFRLEVSLRTKLPDSLPREVGRESSRPPTRFARTPTPRAATSRSSCSPSNPRPLNATWTATARVRDPGGVVLPGCPTARATPVGLGTSSFRTETPVCVQAYLTVHVCLYADTTAAVG
jgi:osmotically inducible protein OsmC